MQTILYPGNKNGLERILRGGTVWEEERQCCKPGVLSLRIFGPCRDPVKYPL